MYIIRLRQYFACQHQPTCVNNFGSSLLNTHRPLTDITHPEKCPPSPPTTSLRHATSSPDDTPVRHPPSTTPMVSTRRRPTTPTCRTTTETTAAVVQTSTVFRPPCCRHGEVPSSRVRTSLRSGSLPTLRRWVSALSRSQLLYCRSAMQTLGEPMFLVSLLVLRTHMAVLSSFSLECGRWLLAVCFPPLFDPRLGADNRAQTLSVLLLCRLSVDSGLPGQ